jgi:hypothetical protein
MKHYREKNRHSYRPSKTEYLERAKKLAIIRGGKCLSTEYINAKTHLLLACDNTAHPYFKISYDNLKQGKWCRKCRNERLRGKYKYTINDMNRLAKKRGGQCLSEKFLGVKRKLEWSCENPDHPAFLSDPDHVINSGTWCPKCGEEKKGRDLRPFEDVLEIIKKRGGKFVSFIDDYEGLKTRIKVKCANGHTWPVTVSSLLHAKSWCQKCLDPLGEQITRKIFEKTYGVPFKKLRPDFLKTEKAGRLELDGYNSELGLAFEYQGPYHRRPAQIKRDKIKAQICLEKGIKLIEIPYIKNPWPPEKVLKIVATEIRKVNPERKVILPDEDFFSQKLKELRELARSRGGNLLSNTYLGSRNRLLWSCSNANHPPWKATPENIIRNESWCPYCKPNAPLNIEILQEFGKTVGLTLISKEYRGANELYDWKCKNGHIVKRSKSNINQSVKRGLDACKICAGTSKDVSIENLIQIALNRGGKCLSTTYVNAHSAIRWRCALGHEFSRNWNKVQQGYWCPRKGCPDNRRFHKREELQLPVS